MEQCINDYKKTAKGFCVSILLAKQSPFRIQYRRLKQNRTKKIKNEKTKKKKMKKQNK